MSPTRRDFVTMTLGALLAQGCRDSSSPLPTAEAAGIAPGFRFDPVQEGYQDDTPMARRDTPRGIRCWFSAFYLDAITPERLERYLSWVDELPNEKGSKRLGYDDPDKDNLDVLFLPRVKLVAFGYREGEPVFFAGAYRPFFNQILLCWPPEGDSEEGQAWLRGLIAHEAAHRFGWAGDHPENCATCYGVRP